MDAKELPWADFWALIESGRDDPTVVEARIRAMSEQELINLWWRYQDAVDELLPGDWDYSGHEQDTADWVVRQGKAYFDRVLADAGKFPADPGDYGGVLSYPSVVAEALDDLGAGLRDQDYPPMSYTDVEPDEFWELIDAGRDDPTVVERRVAAMSGAERAEFQRRHEEAVAALLDGDADEHRRAVAVWIVQMGRRFYEVHLDNPTFFPPHAPPDRRDYATPPRRAGLLARLFGHGDP